MSFQHLKYFENVAIIDSYLGLMPIIGSILRCVEQDENTDSIKDLLTKSRRLMILEETYSNNHNKNLSNVDCCKVTQPEELFFEQAIQSNMLGTGFTKKIFEELKSKKYINSYNIKKEKRGCYEIQKNSSKSNLFVVSRELNKHMAMFTGNNLEIKLLWSYPDFQKTQTISKQIEFTCHLLKRFQNNSLISMMQDLEPEILDRSNKFQNNLILPLVGVIRIPHGQVQFVMYLLSYYEYDGNQKSITDLHLEISDYAENIVEKDKKVNELLFNIRRLNKGVIEPKCYVKTMVARPKNEPEKTKKIIAIQIFGFKNEIIKRQMSTQLLFHKLIEPARKIEWETYCPLTGDYVMFPMGKSSL